MTIDLDKELQHIQVLCHIGGTAEECVMALRDRLRAERLVLVEKPPVHFLRDIQEHIDRCVTKDKCALREVRDWFSRNFPKQSDPAPIAEDAPAQDDAERNRLADEVQKWILHPKEFWPTTEALMGRLLAHLSRPAAASEPPHRAPVDDAEVESLVRRCDDVANCIGICDARGLARECAAFICAHRGSNIGDVLARNPEAWVTWPDLQQYKWNDHEEEFEADPMNFLHLSPGLLSRRDCREWKPPAAEPKPEKCTLCGQLLTGGKHTDDFYRDEQPPAWAKENQ